jgi:peptidoglycan hydrolase-like protein with peptidoglycan-binding domain
VGEAIASPHTFAWSITNIRRIIMPLVRLSKGNRDPEGVNGFVTLLQRFLVLKDFLDHNTAGADPVNGNFDAETESAVKSLQAKSQVRVSGVVDGETWAAIADVSSPLAVVNPSVPSSALPELWSDPPSPPFLVDSAVTVLQRLLFEHIGKFILLEDVVNRSELLTMLDVQSSGGSYGPKTEATVKAFQINRELLPDGKVGNDTWEKLLFPDGRNPVSQG